MTSLFCKQEAYNIIGACMDVHKELGKDFSEIVYGNALEIAFKNSGIHFQREVKYNTAYKRNTLLHCYIADFIIERKIVLEIKAIETLTKSHVKQTLNYLAATKIKLGLLVNFREDSLTHKRIIL